MIIQQEAKEQNVIVSGGFKQKEFKIKNKEFIFDVLSDKIYSNKIGAVVREIISNAVDANIEVKNTSDRVLIHLPSSEEPYFSIRDFGPGMDTERINVFISFGDSTKRDSEDQIGYFGMGSKSPFAYSDSFYITTWVGGFKWEYMAYINDERKRNLMLLNKTKSEEKNGTEVKINIQTASDFRKFTEEFFDIWGFSIHLFDLQGIDHNFEKDIRTFHPHLFQKHHSRKNVMFGNFENCSANPGIIVMNGAISYQLDTQTISSLSKYGNMIEFDQNLYFYLKHGIVIKLKVGDLKLSVNREYLEICEQNANVINDAIVGLYEEIRNGILNVYENSKNSFQKLKYFHSIYGKFNFVNTCPYLKPFSESNISYDGMDFDDVISVNKYRESDQIYPLSENIWFYYIKGQLTLIENRIRGVFTKNDFLSKINVIKFESQERLLKFRKTYPLCPLIPLHGYDPISIRRKNPKIAKNIQLENALKEQKITLDNGEKVHVKHFMNEAENTKTKKYYTITSFNEPVDEITKDATERTAIKFLLRRRGSVKLQEYCDRKIKVFKFASSVKKHIPKNWNDAIPMYSDFIRNGEYSEKFQKMICCFYLKNTFKREMIPTPIENFMFNIFFKNIKHWEEVDSLYHAIIKHNKKIRKMIANYLKLFKNIINHVCINFTEIFIPGSHINPKINKIRESAFKAAFIYIKKIKGAHK